MMIAGGRAVLPDLLALLTVTVVGEALSRQPGGDSGVVGVAVPDGVVEIIQASLSGFVLKLIHQWNVARGPPALAGGGIASSSSYKRTVCIMIR
jgi:hypothetical protein